MPPPPFVCGDRVHVHFSDDQCWYKGVVSDMVKEPGEDEISYSITYDDGSSESGVKAQDMRMQGRPGNRVLATLDAALRKGGAQLGKKKRDTMLRDAANAGDAHCGGATGAGSTSSSAMSGLSAGSSSVGRRRGESRCAAAAAARASPFGSAPYDCDAAIPCSSCRGEPSGAKRTLGSFAAERARASFADAFETEQRGGVGSIRAPLFLRGSVPCDCARARFEEELETESPGGAVPGARRGWPYETPAARSASTPTRRPRTS